MKEDEIIKDTENPSYCLKLEMKPTSRDKQEAIRVFLADRPFSRESSDLMSLIFVDFSKFLSFIFPSTSLSQIGRRQAVAH